MQKQQAHNDNGVATLTQHYPDANAMQTQCEHRLLSMETEQEVFIDHYGTKTF